MMTRLSKYAAAVGNQPLWAFALIQLAMTAVMLIKEVLTYGN
jgi:hypothetical protein